MRQSNLSKYEPFHSELHYIYKTMQINFDCTIKSCFYHVHHTPRELSHSYISRFQLYGRQNLCDDCHLHACNYNEIIAVSVVCSDLGKSLVKPPHDQSSVQYIQWLRKLKDGITKIDDGGDLKRSLNACLAHLEVCHFMSEWDSCVKVTCTFSLTYDFNSCLLDSIGSLTPVVRLLMV